MADITMCTNTECSKRGECYRFIARPKDHRQSYCWFENDERGYCDEFWPVEDEDVVTAKHDPRNGGVG